jgi:hypothetical protein
MEKFVEIEKFKNYLVGEEDKIIEEKSFLFNQIKKLEFEETLLKNNLNFFENYLQLLINKDDITLKDFNIKNEFNEYTENM